MSAPTPDLGPRSITSCLEGYATALEALVNDFDFTVTVDDIADDIGVMNIDDRTISIDRQSPLTDQVYFLSQCWLFCALDPHASALEATGNRHLMAVPDPLD